jgi:ketosteroid isomerase-like protein
MKSIAPILVSAGLLLFAVNAAVAQDAPTGLRHAFPSRTEQAAPTPTPSPKPRARPSPATSATPITEGKPTPTPAKKEAEAAPTPTPEREAGERPSRRVLREKPIRAVEPRAPWIRRIPAQKIDGPPAYKPTFDLSGGSNWATNATIRSMENKWQAAVKAHDVDALDKMLDDNFVATSASGKRASKERLLSELRKDKNTYRTAHVRGTSVRMLRPGVAVITGTLTESGTKENGERFHNSRRFTDTWKERDGRWVCTASEVTAIPER